MERCPQCHRLGLEYGECLWKDCHYPFNKKTFKKPKRSIKWFKGVTYVN